MDHPKIRTDPAGDLYLNFGEYGQEVEVACFSGDGSRLLTVQDVGVARVWDVASGRRVAEVRPASPLAGSRAGPTTAPFQVFIEAAALHPTGELALLGLNDGTAGVFSVADGKRRTTFHHPDRPPAKHWELIRAADFSPDGSLAAVGFFGRCVGVWDVPSGRPVAFLRSGLANRLHGPAGWARDTLVSSVAVSADNRFVFAGHADMTATLWELETGRVILDAYEHSEETLALWQGGGLVRWAASGGTVWEAGPEACVRRLATGESWHEAAFAPDGTALLVRSPGGVRRWSLAGAAETLAEWTEDANRPHPTRSLGFAPGGGAWFYPAAGDGLTVACAAGRVKLACPPRNLRAAFSPKGDLLATHGENRLRLWAVPSGELQGELADGKGFYAVAFSPDGSLLAAGTLGRVTPEGLGPPRTLSLWAVADRRLVRRWEAHGHQIHRVAFLPDGGRLVSSSLDRTVRLWRLPNREAEEPVEAARLRYDDLAHEHLHVLSDGRILVFRSNRIEVWRGLRDRVAELPVGVGFRDRWDVSADERFLAVARGFQTVEVWDLETGDRATGCSAGIPRPEVVPKPGLLDARRPAAGCCLWRTAGGNFAHVGDGPRGWATPLRLSGDGRYLVLPCRDSAAVVDLDPEPRVIAELPFQGRLRASRVAASRVLAVNSQGRVFQAPR